MATAEHHVIFETTTRDEIRSELDRLARDQLDLSGDEFLAQLEEGGRLDESSPAVSRLAVLARLLKD